MRGRCIHYDQRAALTRPDTEITAKPRIRTRWNKRVKQDPVRRRQSRKPGLKCDVAFSFHLVFQWMPQLPTLQSPQARRIELLESFIYAWPFCQPRIHTSDASKTRMSLLHVLLGLQSN